MKKMAVLTQPQGSEPGARESDFFFGIEGEMALPSQSCDRDQGDLDGVCGCLRSFTGLVSSKAATTVMVVELVYTLEQVEVMVDAYYKENWPGCDGLAEAAITWMAQFDDFPVGQVLEQREVIQVRT